MFPKRLNFGVLVLVAGLFIQCHNHPAEATQEVATTTAAQVTETVKEGVATAAAEVKEASAVATSAVQDVAEAAKPTLTAAKESIAATSDEVVEKSASAIAATKEVVKEKVKEVKEKVTEAPKKKAKPKPKKRSKISFKETLHEYGTIKQGDVVKHDFKFTNTGNAPLVIKKVDVSCGCTFPSYPFIPIEPGKEGTIGVTFNSTGKIGPQKPTVTVVTNGRPRTLKLNLKGYVE